MLLNDLAAVVGFDHCLTDPDLRASYETDWTGRYRGQTPAVIRPGSVEELASVIGLCHRAEQAVVVQGGNTGMVGGGVPLGNEIVISVTRLGNLQILSDAEVKAGAGATLARVQEAAASVGARFGVDTAARDSATVGGMIATNAGGMNVVRFGPMGDQLNDAGVVLADGRYVPSLEAVPADDRAMGLFDSLPGSEGVLAVVAHATLAIAPVPPRLAVAMVEVTESELGSLAAGLSDVPGLFAAELFGSREVELTAQTVGRAAPVDGDWLLLLECRSATDPVADLEQVVGDLPAVVATNQREGGELWLFREALTESVSRLGIPNKFDVRVPHSALNRLRAVVEEAAPDGQVFVWGHLFSNREGAPLANMHVNVIGEVDDESVFDVVEELGGSIAAEHGLGAAKRHRAAVARADLPELWQLKRRLDPRGILNPNAVFPTGYWS
jgi:FAD/FMN-containing dehydrogenase